MIVFVWGFFGAPQTVLITEALPSARESVLFPLRNNVVTAEGAVEKAPP